MRSPSSSGVCRAWLEPARARVRVSNVRRHEEELQHPLGAGAGNGPRGRRGRCVLVRRQEPPSSQGALVRWHRALSSGEAARGGTLRRGVAAGEPIREYRSLRGRTAGQLQQALLAIDEEIKKVKAEAPPRSLSTERRGSTSPEKEKKPRVGHGPKDQPNLSVIREEHDLDEA